jgi:hypothetical protein
VPAHLQHFGVLLWHLVVCGRGRPAFGRVSGLGYAAAQLWYATKREMVRDDSRWREALRQTALGGRLLLAPQALREQRRQARAAATASRANVVK